MAESKTKTAAAKALASKDAKPKTKKVAAKVLASEKPNQAVAEAAVQEIQAKGRGMVDQVRHVDIPEIADGATELVADGAEVVAQQFEQVAKVSRRISGRDISLVLAGVGVGVVIGGYVGFRVAEKRLRTKFDELLAEETDQIKDHYQAKLVAKEGELTKPDLNDLVAFQQEEKEKQAANDIATEMGYVAPSESATISTEPKTPSQIMRDTPETEQMRQVRENSEKLVSEIEGGKDRTAEREQFVRETRNIFAERDEALAGAWDYAKEIKSRDPRYPYVIHVDEWRENPGEHEQVDLTYYEGDNVLAGENDRIIDDAEEAIGLANLNRFGHGGADTNTVHIRNEVREIDYEVVRSQGTYAQEVHGFDPEDTGLTHSDRPVRGRLRFDDE